MEQRLPKSHSSLNLSTPCSVNLLVQFPQHPMPQHPSPNLKFVLKIKVGSPIIHLTHHANSFAVSSNATYIKPRSITSMSTATGAFKLAAMKRNPLSFQKQSSNGGSNGSSPGQEMATVWKRTEEKPKVESDILKKSILNGDLNPNHDVKSVTFDVHSHISHENAVSDEEPTEEELLKQGIHLARRLSSDAHHREFNWDEDDDDSAWPMNLNSSLLPMLNSTDEPDSNIHESNGVATVPIVETSPPSTPWKITQPHSVTPIGKQLKELSEQRQLQQEFNDHHYNPSHNEFWHTQRDNDRSDGRYRYNDYERRYRSDIPLPRPELFNEANGQVEPVTRRQVGNGRLGFGRYSDQAHPVENNEMLESYERHNYEGHKRSPEVKNNENIPLARGRTKSIVEEQEEVMRLARENARKRKEEEQKREKEQHEAAKRKADELVAKLSAKSKLIESPEPSSSEPSYVPKPIILQPIKQRRGSSFSGEDSLAFRTVNSVIGDDTDVKDQTRSTSDGGGANSLWSGNNSSNSRGGLWNSPSGARSTSDGGLWGPIKVTSIYNTTASTNPRITSPPPYRSEQDIIEGHNEQLSPNASHRSMFQSSWGALNGNTKEIPYEHHFTPVKGDSWKQSPNSSSSPHLPNTPASAHQPSDLETRSRLVHDSPSLSRGMSKFFPTHQDLGETKEEDPNAQNRHTRTIVTCSPMHYLADLLDDEAITSPRVVLPPSARVSEVVEHHPTFKAPSLNSIQALQSTIAEKLGTNVSAGHLFGSRQITFTSALLPIPRSPVVSSDIPPENSTTPAVINYDKVFVPQAEKQKETVNGPSSPSPPQTEAATTPNTTTTSTVKSFADAAAAGGGTESHKLDHSADDSTYPIDTILKCQSHSANIEQVQSMANHQRGITPYVKLGKTDTLGEIESISADWDKEAIIPEKTFSTSSFYFETPMSVAYLREFKPRKDILVAILVPGGRKITTKFRQSPYSGGRGPSARVGTGSGAGAGGARPRRSMKERE